jgi:hypothetical protein
VAAGDADADYLIMKNGETTLGLFHGMFDRNMLTFNPGLTNRMERLESFTDVRAIRSPPSGRAGIDNHRRGRLRRGAGNGHPR